MAATFIPNGRFTFPEDEFDDVLSLLQKKTPTALGDQRKSIMHIVPSF
jgi:hypothetical protein